MITVVIVMHIKVAYIDVWVIVSIADIGDEGIILSRMARKVLMAQRTTVLWAART